MQIVTGLRADLPEGLLNQAAAYRHKIFVELLGWSLQTKNGVELDQFDRDDTVHVIAQNQQGDICGYARLLPTDKPYLLSELFPQLLPESKLPQSKLIWELSRFAALDLSIQSSAIDNPFSSEIAVDLLRSAIHCALQQGAQRIISVSPLGVERLLRRSGFTAKRAAPPVWINGHLLFACWIDLAPS